MTALVVEGVSLQDLDAEREAVCDGPVCEAPAVAVIIHHKCRALVCGLHLQTAASIFAAARVTQRPIRCSLCASVGLGPDDFRAVPA